MNTIGNANSWETMSSDEAYELYKKAGTCKVETVFEGQLIDWDGDGFYVRSFIERFCYEWKKAKSLNDLVDAEVYGDHYQYIVENDIDWEPVVS